MAHQEIRALLIPLVSCDELRGGTDARHYKHYLLVRLFIKCVSDKYAGHVTRTSEL